LHPATQGLSSLVVLLNSASPIRLGIIALDTVWFSVPAVNFSAPAYTVRSSLPEKPQLLVEVFPEKLR